MKPRTIIGIVFIVASLVKLATIWGLIKWDWFARVSEEPWATYFCICLLIYVGVNLIIESYRRDPDQWLQRPLPIGEDGKRICCSAHYGGDEYVYRGEVFHGARLDAFCGGIRMDLRKAVITEDEVIDIHTFCGGIELYVPTTVNVEVKVKASSVASAIMLKAKPIVQHLRSTSSPAISLAVSILRTEWVLQLVF